MDAAAQARRALELDLRQALTRGEFAIDYQPIVDLATGRVTSCEALLRWNHPERGLIPPSAFIPVAEDTGLIVELGSWVLRQACADAFTWPSDLKVAVNLSASQFRDHALTAIVLAALTRSGLPATRLELEITETAMLHDTEGTIATMRLLQELGVSMALDDFGTGYSSLSYLRRFPFQKIKIDGSFVREIEHDKSSAAIVGAVARMGSQLGMAIVVEGVETAGQLERVRAEGCNEAQGFLLGRPMPSAAVESYLANTRKPRQWVA